MGPDWGVQHIRGWKRNSAGRGEGGQADCQRPWKDREGGRGGDGSRLTSGKQRCAKQPWLTQADGMREGRGGGRGEREGTGHNDGLGVELKRGHSEAGAGEPNRSQGERREHNGQRGTSGYGAVWIGGGTGGGYAVAGQ
jgi:hypothetical protein